MHTGNTPGWNHPLAADLHKPVFAALLLLIAADLALAALSLNWPDGWRWLGAAAWPVAALSLLVGLARRLPTQNVVFAALTLLVSGFAVEFLNARTGLPLGLREFGEGTGLKIVQVGWFTPCLWLCLTLAGRGVARLVFKPYRKLTYYGFWVMGGAALLALLIAPIVAPVALARQWWLTVASPESWTWYQLPWLTVPAWGAVVLLMLAFVTPWLLNKQPVKQPTDWHPLAVWLALLVWLGGHQLVAGQWPALGYTVALGAGTAFAAVRGAG
jgi:hypothetical protein